MKIALDQEEYAIELFIDESLLGQAWLDFRNPTVVLLSSYNVKFVEHIVKRGLNGWLNIVEDKFISLAQCFYDWGCCLKYMEVVIFIRREGTTFKIWSFIFESAD